MNTRASPLLFQKISSSDDFRKPGQSIKTYHPRRVFVERRGSTITRVVNPVAGMRANQTAQNQSAKNQSMRLGSKITVTRDNIQSSSTTTSNIQKPAVTTSLDMNLVQNTKFQAINLNPRNLKSNSTLADQIKKAVIIQSTQSDQNSTKLKRVNWLSPNYTQKKKINPQQNRTPRPALTKPIAVTPPLTKTTTNSTLTTAATISATDTASSSPTNPNSHQSPLQRQMRSYMDHLHFLQAKMKDTQPDIGQVPTASTTVSNGVSFIKKTNSASSTVVTGITNNGLGSGLLAGPKIDKVDLNAARNLSDFSKALQQLSSGLGLSRAATSTLPNRSSIASTSSINPLARFKGSSHKNKLVSPSDMTTSRLQINGVPVSRLISPAVAGQTTSRGLKRLVNRITPISPGGYRKNMLIRNRNGVRIRHLPYKKVMITPSNGVAQNPSSVPVVSAKPTNNPLQRKMVANLNKPRTGVSTTPLRGQLKNGTFLKAHHTIRKNGQSPRTNLQLTSLALSPSAATVSKSNKENIKRRRLSQRTANNSRVAASIDLSKEDDGGNESGGSLSKDVVDTLKKKGISISCVEPSTETGVIKLD